MNTENHFSIKCYNSEQKDNYVCRYTHHFHGAWLFFIFSFYFKSAVRTCGGLFQLEALEGDFSFFVPEPNSMKSIIQLSPT